MTIVQIGRVVYIGSLTFKVFATEQQAADYAARMKGK